MINYKIKTVKPETQRDITILCKVREEMFFADCHGRGISMKSRATLIPFIDWVTDTSINILQGEELRQQLVKILRLKTQSHGCSRSSVITDYLGYNVLCITAVSLAKLNKRSHNFLQHFGCKPAMSKA